MNTPRTLKTAIALALLASAFGVQAAAVPSGCQRVSGEEGADEQYFGSDSEGNPIFCAAGTAKNGTPIPRGSSAGAAVTASPYSDPAQGFNDAASQTGSPYGQGSGGYAQGDYGQGAAGLPPAQTGGWQGSGGQSGAGAGGYGSASGGYGGASGGYGSGGSAGAGGGGGIQGGSFKGGAQSQSNGAGAAGRNPYASGNAFVKRPKKCKTNCPPAGAPVDQGGYGDQTGYGQPSGYGQTGGYGDQPYGTEPRGSAGGPSSSQGDEGSAGGGSWAGASGNDNNHVPVDTPPFGDAAGGASYDPGYGGQSPYADEPVAELPGGSGSGNGNGKTPSTIDPGQFKKPPVDPQQFQPDKLPKPMPTPPGGLLQPLEPQPPTLVKELPAQIPTGNKPATLIDIKPGVAVGGSAAIEAAKNKKKKPPTVTQRPKP